MPRLNCRSRDGAGAAILANEDTRLLAQQAEGITLRWAAACAPWLHETLLRVKTVIPPELLIASTIWSALTLVGDLEDGCNHLHVDSNDVVSLIVQVGTEVEGGATVYYNGRKFRKATKLNPKQGRETCGEEVFRVPHKHGQYQVAHFEQIVHEGEKWKGKRGIISFYLNRQLLEHFERHGREYFDENRRKLL